MRLHYTCGGLHRAAACWAWCSSSCSSNNGSGRHLRCCSAKQLLPPLPLRRPQRMQAHRLAVVDAHVWQPLGSRGFTKSRRRDLDRERLHFPQPTSTFRTSMESSATSNKTPQATYVGKIGKEKRSLLVERSPPQAQEEVPSDEGIIPVCLRDGALVCDTGQVLVQGLPGCTEHNVEASSKGSAVLGLTASGPHSMVDFNLGKLSFHRYLACARKKLWWMIPEWGTSMAALPPETQFLLLELEEGGPYALFLPLIDGDFRATLRSSRHRYTNVLCLRTESGADRVLASHWKNLLHVSAGHDPFALVERGMTAAAKLSGGATARTQKVLPPSLDCFGWCTWDAFYSTVSARGLQEGLKSLEAGGISPALLIIDDGWQLTDLDSRIVSPAKELADKMDWSSTHKRLLSSGEDEYFQSSASWLADTASHMPQGTSAGNVMPTLAGMGAQKQYHFDHYYLKRLEKAVEQEERDWLLSNRQVQEEARLIVRLASSFMGWSMGLLSAAFLIFYQWVIEPAPPGSLRVKAFAAACQGFLRSSMLSFFGSASDFTRRLVSVKANGKFSSPEAGPEEDWAEKQEKLGEVVKLIKQRYGVKYIYCWHGLPAYWGGVMPEAPAMKPLGAKIHFARPTPGLLEIEPSMAWNPAVLAGIGVASSPELLYRSMHTYLASSGIDGVKVDCQAGVGLIGSELGGGPALSRRYQGALEASIKDSFKENHCINCMCHSTENLYRMSHTSVLRASDDFYPRDPASCTPHIAACAYNSLFLGVLAQTDWDMFQSKHFAARIHSVARAVSGGAVYVSDKPGVHDFDLLKQLVLPGGKILRARLPGRPTRDCLFCDPLRDGKTLLKVWNVNQYNGIVAVLHLQGSSWSRSRRKFYTHEKQPKGLETQVCPRDVEPFRRASMSEFVLYSFFGKEMVVLAENERYSVTCQPLEAEMITISPILYHRDTKFAPIGFHNMINGGGAVLSCDMIPYDTRTSIITSNGSSRDLIDMNEETTNDSNNSSGRSLDAYDPTSDRSSRNEGKGNAGFFLRVQGCGEFLMYSNSSPKNVLVNSSDHHFVYDKNSGRLTVKISASADMICHIEAIY